MRGRGVDPALLKASETDTLGGQLLDGAVKVGGAPGEAVEARDYEGVALAAKI